MSNLCLQKACETPGELNQNANSRPPPTDICFTRSGVNPGIGILIKATEWIRCFINFILKPSFLMHLGLGQRNIFSPLCIWVNFEWQISLCFLKGHIYIVKHWRFIHAALWNELNVELRRDRGIPFSKALFIDCK